MDYALFPEDFCFASVWFSKPGAETPNVLGHPTVLTTLLGVI